MGVSTDGLLMYGVPISEDVEVFDEDGNYTAPFNKLPPGLTMVEHCCDEYVMHFLAVEKSYFVAARGNPVRIDEAKMTVDADAATRLADFVKEHGFATDGQPGWYLASWWG